MKYVDENCNVIAESAVDLSKGFLVQTTITKEDAVPIDNVTKFVLADEDYEPVQMYVLNPPPQAPTPQEDTDALLVELAYRLTLLELGIVGGEENAV